MTGYLGKGRRRNVLTCKYLVPSLAGQYADDKWLLEKTVLFFKQVFMKVRRHLSLSHQVVQ
mgnify:CR=1 FL=1